MKADEKSTAKDWSAMTASTRGEEEKGITETQED